MAGNPFFQSLDPNTVPDPITPHGAPSDPAGYAGVTPPGTGPAPAPYSLSAPQDIAGITAATQAAMNLTGGQEGAATGAGLPVRHSPRQAQADAILGSPQGAGAMSVPAGFPDYENTNINPGPNLETPIQGQMGTYPSATSTVQPGVPQFMAGLGGQVALPGVPPEGGSMAPSPGGNYPGTTQDGITTYGTS
jgi:hypothetical protein